jgi:hypothetical protein
MDSKMMFPLTAEFKAAMGVWATEHNTSIADLIRTAVAEKIGYDLEPINEHHKFANAAERKAHYAAQAKEDRKLLAQLKANPELAAKLAKAAAK